MLDIIWRTVLKKYKVLLLICTIFFKPLATTFRLIDSFWPHSGSSAKVYDILMVYLRVQNIREDTFVIKQIMVRLRVLYWPLHHLNIHNILEVQLKYSNNLEEFRCIKDKGASLSWSTMISDLSGSTASRILIHLWAISPHGLRTTFSNLCQIPQYIVTSTNAS